MKFVHLSDVRLGSIEESGYGWAKSRETEIEENLGKILSEAEEEDTDLVMITGGLFDHTPVDTELMKAGDIFAAHPRIEVVIIAAGPDALSLSSPVMSFIWPKNVHFVLKAGVERISLSRIHTEIYAASQIDGRTADPKEFCEESSKLVENEGIKLAMIRPLSTLDADLDALKEAFGGSEFSYVAVGGPNKYREIEKGLIYASGSLEAESSLDRGKHGLIKGQIPFVSGSLEDIDFRKMSSGSYVTLNIKINAKAQAKEIYDSISFEMEKRGRANIYSLNISGMRNPDEKIDLESLKQNFRIRKVTDATEPQYDYQRLFKEHPQDMIGFFISRVAGKRDQMSETEKRAMFYGIDALISTSKEEV